MVGHLIGVIGVIAQGLADRIDLARGLGEASESFEIAEGDGGGGCTWM